MDKRTTQATDATERGGSSVTALEPIKPEVVPAARDLSALTLEELTELAQEERAASEAHLVGALRHYVQWGEVLLEVRDRPELNNGWQEWLKDQRINRSVATQAMRLAAYRDRLPAEAFEPWRDQRGFLREATANRVATFIRGLPPVNSDSNAYDASVKAEALRLVKEGVPWRETARLMGVSAGSVYNWMYPEKYKRNIRAEARRQKAKRDALRTQRRAEAVAKAGGSIKKAYDLVLSLARELDAALGNATDTEMRNALRSAYSAATRSEAELLRALRLGDTGDNT